MNKVEVIKYYCAAKFLRIIDSIHLKLLDKFIESPKNY